MVSDPKVWLNLNINELDDSRNRAIEDSLLSDRNNEDMKNYMLYPNAHIQLEEFGLDSDSDTLSVFGRLQTDNFELGNISLDIPLSQEIAIQIIDRFMKKLGKIKTVLEATK